jgi:hypothetical protein
MIDIPTFLMTARQSTAIIHVTIPRERIRAVMGPSYRELIDTLRGQGLASAWRAFDAWIAAEGRVASPFLWETYLTDPNVDRDPATWRTELTRPLVT